MKIKFKEIIDWKFIELKKAMRSLKELTTQQNRLFVFLIIQTQLRIENSVFIELNDWDQELRPPIST